MPPPLPPSSSSLPPPSSSSTSSPPPPFAAIAAHCSAARAAVALLLLCCIVLVAITFDAEKIEALLLWVQENKAHGSMLFLALYIAGVILMLPAMIMAMAAGAIFGILGGSILAWIGSCTGQVIAFIIGRYLLRAIVISTLHTQFPKWTAIDRAMVTDGWKLVILLRLSPIAPWNILNYALSVTAVPLMAYTVASSLAILPYLVLFVYLGSMARSLADIFTGTAGKLDTSTTIIMGVVSCTAMVGIVWYTTHVSRQAVNDALRQHAEELPVELTADDEVVQLLGGAEVGTASHHHHHHLQHPHHHHASPPEIELQGAGGNGATVLSSSMAGTTPGGAAALAPPVTLAPGLGIGGAQSTNNPLNASSKALTPRGPGRQRSSAAMLAAAAGDDDGMVFLGSSGASPLASSPRPLSKNGGGGGSGTGWNTR